MSGVKAPENIAHAAGIHGRAVRRRARLVRTAGRAVDNRSDVHQDLDKAIAEVYASCDVAEVKRLGGRIERLAAALLAADELPVAERAEREALDDLRAARGS